MHNLGTVFKFEVVRTLKKKSFWIMALSFPLIMGAVFGVIFLSNKATEDATRAMEKQQFSIQIKDDTGLIKDDILSPLDITEQADTAVGIAKVKNGELDAFFYYPSDLSRGIEVYGVDVGLFNNSRYNTVANTLLKMSVEGTLDANVKIIVGGTLAMNVITFKDGAVSNPFMQMIAPGFFLVFFYFLIAMFGAQALTSTTEEKENRVIEMILTTIQARTLITGKILSLIVLALIQALILVTPVIIAYALLHDNLTLPTFDLNAIPLNPLRIGTAIVIFGASFMLFMGLLVTIGAATPTAKEANGFMGAVMVLLFGPLYAAPLFISSPEQPIVQFLSYFPFTAPIPLLLRNAAGNLTWPEVLLSATILVVTTVFVIRIAVRVFQHGALQYTRKLSLKEIFGRS